METGVIHHGTDRAFQQHFWRKAFIYARILEKDEINTDEIERYKDLHRALHVWIKRLKELDGDYKRFMQRPLWWKLRTFDLDAWLSSVLPFMLLFFVWPIMLFIFFVMLDAAVFLPQSTTKNLIIIPKLVPSAKEYIDWFYTFEWGVLKCGLTPYFVQAKIISAFVENTS